MRTLTRSRLLALGALTCLLGAIVVWRLRAAWLEDDLAFVAAVSRLPLPASPRDAASYDNGQFAILVSIDLNPGQTDAILRTGKLHHAIHGAIRVPPQMPSDFRSINRLPAPDRIIQGSGDLYHGGDCSTHHAWTALLDKKSNRVWIEVLYPDWAGSDPGCRFSNIERSLSILDAVL